MTANLHRCEAHKRVRRQKVQRKSASTKSVSLELEKKKDKKGKN